MSRELDDRDDVIPSIDSAEPEATYLDWNRNTTRVVSGPIGSSYAYPGTRYESREAAYAGVTQRFGRIFEANYIAGRYFFRVRKP